MATFRKAIDSQGRASDTASYAVILGSLTARQMHDEAAAKALLEDVKGKLTDKWPHNIVQFLRGEIDEPTLLDLANDNDQLTEAHGYLGMHASLEGRTDDALTHFRWVKDKGNKQRLVHTIALAELTRLETATPVEALGK